ncbi:hypothetical protein BESB_026300 [Besnoitia besnoiti]|uniref:Transmembrane protein n=1 Tax=Besnoitia besnoiti TaxID=94643 RepID=A0A2A9M6Z2_BESBE|nr:uncharacterized protein BESB_026300 [Besnoitia besnoiti]PFH31656.1 hypothetical protein BESB_026300 [Besnoitia besnoiti]
MDVGVNPLLADRARRRRSLPASPRMMGVSAFFFFSLVWLPLLGARVADAAPSSPSQTANAAQCPAAAPSTFSPPPSSCSRLTPYLPPPGKARRARPRVQIFFPPPKPRERVSPLAFWLHLALLLLACLGAAATLLSLLVERRRLWAVAESLLPPVALWRRARRKLQQRLRRLACVYEERRERRIKTITQLLFAVEVHNKQKQRECALNIEATERELETLSKRFLAVRARLAFGAQCAALGRACCAWLGACGSASASASSASFVLLPEDSEWASSGSSEPEREEDEDGASTVISSLTIDSLLHARISACAQTRAAGESTRRAERARSGDDSDGQGGEGRESFVWKALWGHSVAREDGLGEGQSSEEEDERGLAAEAACGRGWAPGGRDDAGAERDAAALRGGRPPARRRDSDSSSSEEENALEGEDLSASASFQDFLPFSSSNEFSPCSSSFARGAPAEPGEGLEVDDAGKIGAAAQRYVRLSSASPSLSSPSDGGDASESEDLIFVEALRERREHCAPETVRVKREGANCTLGARERDEPSQEGDARRRPARARPAARGEASQAKSGGADAVSVASWRASLMEGAVWGHRLDQLQRRKFLNSSKLLKDNSGATRAPNAT